MVLQRRSHTGEARPWRPFSLIDEMERMMDDALRRPSILLGRSPTRETSWAPAVEMYEKDDKLFMRAEIPGMEKKDIKVSVSEDLITIEGERKSREEVKEDNYYRCEMSYGKFARSIALPANANPEKVDAKYENGILEISMSKMPETQPKKLDVTIK
jgi:HSP20 family protein